MLKIMKIGAIVMSLGLLLLPFYLVDGPRGFNGRDFDIIGYLSVAMLLYLGILFGALHQQLLGNAGSVVMKDELRNIFSSRYFWISIVTSPIILIGVYALLKEKPVDLAAYAFAFQNGFFCERVFASKLEKMTGQ